MNNSIRLVDPTVELEAEYISFYEEWKSTGEEMIPWVIQKDPSNFKEMVQFLMDNKSGKNLPKGWVPDSTYWLINDDNRVLGAVNIRHGLTEGLLNSGGHIGYGIRPSERRKGYATKILALALKKIKELDIHRVLVCCDATNIGSEKTILNNGGIQDKDFIEEDGNVVKRFWIDI